MGSEDDLMLARRALEGRGEILSSTLQADIAASWRRCIERGLDPARVPTDDEVDRDTLIAARKRHDLVWRLARSEIEALHGQIAGSNHLIAFATADGLILDALIDGSFTRPASDRALQPGVRWSENRRGTNALGLSLALNRPVIVHGAEHFFRAHAPLTCAAAPICAPDGALLGVLDASSLCTTRQFHTLALIRMAATQIENGLFRERFRDQLLVAFHSREEYLHTLGAGLLALSSDGRILGASPQAKMMLQDLPVAENCPFGAVFTDRFSTTIARRPAGARFRLRDRSGSGLAAEIIAIAPAAPARPVERRRDEAFVADDPAVARALSLASRAALRALPILIGGETGTGKEELARAAHLASRRSGRFVAVNCAALPQALVEAELFGYAEGAFTGARRGGAPGLAVEAHGGTLFLDEIGDMDARAQAALLRLLDDWVVRPVGGGAGRRVDVLLISATHVPLDDAAAAGRFRADLLHRLSVVTVSLPRLADRQDFGPVARFLLRRIDPAGTLSTDAIAQLRRHSWPGNIRELRNVLLRATLEQQGPLDAPDIALYLPAPNPPVPKPALPDDLQTEIARRIVSTRAALGGSVSETARRLGVSRNRVYRAARRMQTADDSCRR